MKTILKFLFIIAVITLPHLLTAQISETEYPILRTRKANMGTSAPIDSVVYVYNSKNQLIERTEYLFNVEDCYRGSPLDVCTNRIRYSYTYHPNGLEASKTILLIGDNQLLNGGRQFFEYDDKKNIINHITQSKRSGQDWENIRQRKYQYDERNNTLEALLQIWDPDQNKWLNIELITREYNLFNQETLYRKQFDSDGNWITSSEKIHSYDEQNRLLFRLHLSLGINKRDTTLFDTYQYNFNDTVELETIYFYTRENDHTEIERKYDENRKLIQSTIKNFYKDTLVDGFRKVLDSTSTELKDVYKNYRYGHNYIPEQYQFWYLTSIKTNQVDENDNVIFEMLQEFHQDEVYAQRRSFKEYNTFHQCTYSRMEEWDLEQDVWFPIKQSTSSYMGTSLLEKRLEFQRDAQWYTFYLLTNFYDEMEQLIYREEYYEEDFLTAIDHHDIYLGEYQDLIVKTNFQAPLFVSVKELPAIPFSIFPNPIQDYITIELNNSQFLPSKLQLYNILGKIVYDEKISNLRQHFSLPILPNGSYILRINNGKAEASKKILIMY